MCSLDSDRTVCSSGKGIIWAIPCQSSLEHDLQTWTIFVMPFWMQDHSLPLMSCIEWILTADHNVEVLNDTADLYRYFDCTTATEFLYRCVQRTIEVDLPKEIDFLKRHDRAKSRIMETVEMPDRLAENFILFVRQNGGKLSASKREKFFAAMSDAEIKNLEDYVNAEFADFDNTYKIA